MDAKVPRVESRWTCITTDAAAPLAAVVSSYFNEEGTYFPVFWFPRIQVPYSASMDIGQDGYIARALGGRHAHHINNALARIAPSKILLLGLTESEQTYLRALLPSDILVEANSLSEISRLPFAERAAPALKCRSADIIQGLLVAKFSRSRLEIDESAPSLPRWHFHGSNGIVVLESDSTIDDVAAANYAFAINADCALVPPADKNQVRDTIPRFIHSWKSEQNHRAYEQLKRKITKRIKGINFLRYNFATFFTVGLPYGLVLKNLIPCSHVLKHLNCGVYIANCMMEEHEPSAVNSAVLFSPEHFDTEETGELVKRFEASNYIVNALVGKNATLKNLGEYGSHFPYDVMHICAHGGETNGYFVVQTFLDRKGTEHKIEFYEIIGVSPVGGDRVKLNRKLIFKALDGQRWGSRPLKALPPYVGDDLTRALKLNPANRLIRVPVSTPIPQSCHIQCYDSIHQGEFDVVGGLCSPIIFNNSCSSTRELAACFLHAGARAYISTMWNIGTNAATASALGFYEDLFSGGRVLPAFHRMTTSIQSDQYKHIYILWGLHFSTVQRPTAKSDEKLFAALVRDFLLWTEKLATTTDEEIKRNSVPIASFLLRRIEALFSPERIRSITNFRPSIVKEAERALPTTSEDDLTRGELEIDSEQQGSVISPTTPNP